MKIVVLAGETVQRERFPMHRERDSATSYEREITVPL